MKNAKYLIFRYLTNAEFYNIYKLRGSETKGGGQTYIDVGTDSVSLPEWRTFFLAAPSVVETLSVNGPKWRLRISGIGISGVQDLTIYQRRRQSVSIAAQRVGSAKSNRVVAWLPANGFPAPDDPTDRHACPPGLAVYIVRAADDTYWAGWFQVEPPTRDKSATDALGAMLSDETEGHAGMLAFPIGTVFFDELDPVAPFSSSGTGSSSGVARTGRKPRLRYRTEEETIAGLFDEDEGFAPKSVIRETKTRNLRAVKRLKKLYGGKCQITGNKDTFPKKDGELYCEAHHLIPLGEAGSDSPFNIIIVSPLVHRMLHYANVSPIELARLNNKNQLTITINGARYVITWHPEHAKLVRKSK